MNARDTAPPLPHSILFTGLFLAGCGCFLALSLFSANILLSPEAAAAKCWTGLAGFHLAFFTRISFGTLPSLVLALLCVAWGCHVICRRSFFASWPQALGGILIVASLSILAGVLLNEEKNPLSGGLLSWIALPPGRAWVGQAGLFGLGMLGLIGGAVLAFGAMVLQALGWIYRSADYGGRCCSFAGGWLSRGVSAVGKRAAAWREAHRLASETEVAKEPLPAAEEAKEASVSLALGEEEAFEAASSLCLYSPENAAVPVPPGRSEPAPAKREKAPARSVKPGRILVRSRDYKLPPVELLAEPENKTGETRATLEKRGQILEKTLAEFKIDGRVVGVECGPRVTMFEVALAPGIRVERIFSLANNITMALKAYNVRIVAPIPGKDTVGIEIPNMEDNLVAMRAILAQYDRKKNRLAAPMFLGADITGAPIISDLARMPHLLIAGATGSGKSVCLNSILVSFLMTKSPDELKLILIDPKMVELSRFKDVPHLLSPVVTDMKRAAGILEWACSQMDQRYEQLALVGVNNIAKFNALGEKEVLRRVLPELADEEVELFPKRLPYVVIVVDELADLMLVAGKDVEKSIIRLASKSRAVGIHVILATQRPSVDVITGLIKANMPSRIAFQVASRVDSRTIFDSNGAENLLGAGDMLFMPPASSKLVRAQGVFISDDELDAVVGYCKGQGAPDYHEELEGAVIGGLVGRDDADRDELFTEAARAVIESQRGSVSLLQRKLGIGYGRASRIIDQMAAAGVLGPFRDGKAREILMTLEEYEAAFGSGSEGGAPRSAARAYESAGADEEEEEFEEAEDDGLAGLREDEREPSASVPWEE